MSLFEELYAGVRTVKISSLDTNTTGCASLVVKIGSVNTAGATDIFNTMYTLFQSHPRKVSSGCSFSTAETIVTK